MNGNVVTIIAILTTVCFYILLSTKNKTIKTISWIIYSLLLLVTLRSFINQIIYSIGHPQFWDFTCFYLYGKVSISGYDFYLPESFKTVFDSLRLPDILTASNPDYLGFIKECVNVGFPYPPPTILYFVPLGLLSFQSALVLWTVFISCFAFASIYLIYEMFLKEYKVIGLIMVSILLLAFFPSRSTVYFGQTNLILLFLLLLMRKYSEQKIAGVFLALAMFTKPYMIIFLLIFIVKKKWPTILYFLLSSTILSAITYIIIGKEPFLSYLFNNPSGRFPQNVYFDQINQSLHSVLLRNNLITLGNPAPYIFISIAILLLAGIFFLYLSRKKMYNNIWSLLLLIALLLYPGTLNHYGVLLLFIIFQFFDKSNPTKFSPYVNVIIIGIFYFLSQYSLFPNIMFLLAVIIYQSLKQTIFPKWNLSILMKNKSNVVF